jgi:hypothetical protein
MVEHWTLFPGDKVKFMGHEWEVFITPKGEQYDDSPIVIFRPRYLDRASEMIDAIRQRCELFLIPKKIS